MNNKLSLRGKAKYLIGNYIAGGRFRYYGSDTFFPRGCVLFKLACLYGIYEAENLHILNSLCPPGTVFFDVGANIGLMSGPMAQLDSTRKIVSFEPSPNSVPYLSKTIERSPFKDRWTLVSKALSDKPGEVDFSLCDPFTAGLEGFRGTGRAEVKKIVKVTCSTLDTEWNALGRPNVTLIKIDTEGADLSVLKGATECLKKNGSAILTEWTPKNFSAYGHKAGDLFQWAESMDYAIFSVPSFVKMSSAQHLELACLTQETFLLSPKS